MWNIHSLVNSPLLSWTPGTSLYHLILLTIAYHTSRTKWRGREQWTSIWSCGSRTLKCLAEVGSVQSRWCSRWCTVTIDRCSNRSCCVHTLGLKRHNTGTQYGTQYSTQYGTQYSTQYGTQHGTQYGTHILILLGLKFSEQCCCRFESWDAVPDISGWWECCNLQESSTVIPWNVWNHSSSNTEPHLKTNIILLHHPSEVNRKADKKKKMELDWTHIM